MEPKTRKRRTTKPKNAEITAMTEIIRILEPLSQNAKNRILGWVADHVMDTITVKTTVESFDLQQWAKEEGIRLATPEQAAELLRRDRPIGTFNTHTAELVTTEYQGAD